jgi:hypothetical protein
MLLNTFYGGFKRRISNEEDVSAIEKKKGECSWIQDKNGYKKRAESNCT